MASFVLLLIEQTDVLLTTIEVKPANRLPVVIIQQYAEVALRIAMHDSLRINNSPNNSLNDVEPLQLFQRGVDPVVVGIIFSLGSCGGLCRRYSDRWWNRTAHGRLQAVIDLIPQKLSRSLSGQDAKLLPHLLRDDSVVNAGSEEPHEIIVRLFELVAHFPLDLANVFQLASRIDDRINIERSLGQLLKLWQNVLINI
ncbi:Uncharacterised protein [Streptococcus dysgalactiae subsp. equisimilis]|nr:Uncharacterised protein [Streptococcus dysgalactiae subsp. equisimilis]